MNPDHVLAYSPSWATFDALNPGTVDRLLADRKITDPAAAEQFRQMLRKEPWNGSAVHAAEEASDGLRLRLATNKREDMIQCNRLFDDDNARELTPLATVATAPLIGVPRNLVTTAEALAYAMHVGTDRRCLAHRVPRSWWEGRNQVQHPPNLISVCTQAPRAGHGLSDVRDAPVAPTPDFIAKQARAAQPRQPHSPLGDHGPIRFVRAPHGSHLDGVAVGSESDLQSRVIQVERFPVLEMRGDRLIQAAIPSDQPHTAGAQRRPIQRNEGGGSHST
ncbi:hypothetical protein [Streptomyces sp. SudanB52_2052]|uniref:hypothetical protein n=1 Tax=Streptomyces sp. SudanB52_2052 TaxID=3035276 RepID=UPI003F54DE23